MLLILILLFTIFIILGLFHTGFLSFILHSKMFKVIITLMVIILFVLSSINSIKANTKTKENKEVSAKKQVRDLPLDEDDEYREYRIDDNHLSQDNYPKIIVGKQYYPIYDITIPSYVNMRSIDGTSWGVKTSKTLDCSECASDDTYGRDIPLDSTMVVDNISDREVIFSHYNSHNSNKFKISKQLFNIIYQSSNINVDDSVSVDGNYQANIDQVGKLLLACTVEPGCSFAQEAYEIKKGAILHLDKIALIDNYAKEKSVILKDSSNNTIIITMDQFRLMFKAL